MTSEVTDLEEAGQILEYIHDPSVGPVVTVGHTKFYRVTNGTKVTHPSAGPSLRVGYYQDCRGFFLHHTSKSDVAREVSALLTGV